MSAELLLDVEKSANVNHKRMNNDIFIDQDGEWGKAAVVF